VKTPEVVIFPIVLAACSVNHSAPSGPAAIPIGVLLLVGIAYSVKDPSVVILPICPLDSSVNHSAPSPPAVIP